MRTWVLLTVSTFVAAAAVALAAPPSAAAASACWRSVVDDWFAGHVPATYAPSCYQEALRHLPVDARTYTTAPDDIRRAMLAAIAARATPRVAASARSTNGRTLMGRRAAPATAQKPTAAPATDRPPFERIAAIGAGGAGRVPPTIVFLAVVALFVTAAGASRLRRH